MNNEKIPFLTLDNIGNYFGQEEQEESTEALLAKARKEYDLACKNSVPEKRLMLLNNACIFFDKIIEKDGKIPFSLFAEVKEKLLDLYYIIDEENMAKQCFSELTDFFAECDEESDDNNHFYCKTALSYCHFLDRHDEVQDTANLCSKIYNILQNDNSDAALEIKGESLALLGKLFLEGEVFDRAIAYFYNAYRLIGDIKEKTPEVLDKFASYGFNLGNAFFQADSYEEALQYFDEAIDFCKHNKMENAFDIMKFSYNYSAQVYVCTREYDKAVERYSEFIDYAKNNFSEEKTATTFVEFLYRIAVVCHRFLQNDAEAKKHIDLAREIINSLSEETLTEITGLANGIEKLSEELA